MTRLTCALLLLASACSGSLVLDKVPCHNDGECPTGSYCTNAGTCAEAPSCSAPQALCHDKCTDRSSDVSNCGACGTVCHAPELGAPVCSAGACDFTCNAPAVKVGTQCKVAPGSNPAVTPAAGMNHVALSWGAVTGADNYVVKRGTSAAGPFSDIATVTATTYDDTGLANGTRYYYVVAAQNGAGRGPDSAPAPALTDMPEPTSVTASQNPDGSVALTWTPVANARAYNVYRLATTAGGSFALVIAGVASNDAQDATANPGTSFEYEVEAVGPDATSIRSLPGAITTLLSSPTGFAVSTVTTSSVTMSWNASPGATDYVMQRSDDHGATFTGVFESSSATTFTDTSCVPGKAYVYQLLARTPDVVAAAVQANAITQLDPVTGLVQSGNSTTSITLSWNAVNGALTYRIYRGTSPTPLGGSGATTFADNNLNPGVQYQYSVYGQTPDTISSTPATITAVTAYTPPANLTGTPTTASVSLSWTANGEGATSYVIARSIDGGATYSTLGTSTTAAYTDSVVQPGVQYVYEVKATSSITSSAYSSPKTVVTPLAAPTGVGAVTIASDSIALSWNPSANATSYVVERDTKADGTFDTSFTATGTSFSDTSVVSNEQYIYRVTAKNSVATSAATTIGKVTTPLGTPKNVIITGGNASLALTWAPVAGNVDGYVVQRAPAQSDGTPGTFATLVGTPTTAGLTYTDSGLTPLTTYYYRIASYAAAANPTSSPTSAVAGLIVPPGQPTNFTGTATSPNEITLSWTAPAGSGTQYALQRSTDNVNFTQVNQYYAYLGGTSYVDDTITPGVDYYYRIAGATPAAGFSPYTASIKVIHYGGASTGVPGSLTATGSLNGINLAWTYADGGTYNLERSDDEGVTYYQIASSVAAGTYTDAPGTGFNEWYRVSQVGPTPSAYTAPVVAGMPQIAAPASVGATVNASSVNLTCAAVTGADTYVFSRSTDGGHTWTTLGTVSTPATTDNAPPAGQTVWYTAQAQLSTVGNLSSYAQAVKVTTNLAVAPAAPTISGVYTDTVHLAWTATAGATGYVVQRQLGTTGAFAPVGTTQALPTVQGNGTVTFDDHDTFTPNTQYSWRIDAYTPYTTTKGSAVATVTVPTTSMTAPTLSQPGVTQGTVSLSWSGGGGSSLAGYYVFKSTDGTSFSLLGPLNANNLGVPQVTTTSTTYLDSAVSAGTTYWYKVSTANTLGSTTSHSVTSAAVSATTPPPTPVGVTAAGGATVSGASKVVLSWPQLQGATSFTLSRSLSPSSGFAPLATVTATSYVDTSVSSGTTYYYTLHSNGAGGSSPESTAVTAKPGTGVSGTRLVTYVGDTSAQNTTGVPTDLAATSVQAIDLQGNTYNGVLAADGTWAIEGVPSGNYWLVLNENSTKTLFQTSSRSVDLGFAQLGTTAQVLPTTNPTQLNISGGNLTPAGAFDQFELLAPHSGLYTFGTLPQVPLAIGTKNVSQLVVDFWSQFTGVQPLVNNENLTIAQYGTFFTANEPWVSLVSSITTPPVQMQDGVVTPLSGLSFSAPAASSVNVSYKRSTWRGLASQVAPNALTINDTVGIETSPQITSLGQTGGAMDLFFTAFVDSQSNDLSFGSMAYRNPFPAAWGILGYVQTTVFARYGLPGRTGSRFLNGGFVYREALAQFTTDAASGLLPKLTAPTSVQLNGVPFNNDMAGVGLTPSVSWSPPTGTAPTWYHVVLTRLLPSSTQGVTSTTVAIFETTSTSLTIPPGLLISGAYYVLRVDDNLEPARSIATAPLQPAGPSLHHGTMLTPKFTP